MVNRRIVVIASLITALSFGGMVSGCGGSDESGATGPDTNGPDTANQHESTSPWAEVMIGVDNGALLLDVREPDEFAAGHFEKAQNYPLGLLHEGQMPDARADTPILVYCERGVRAEEAAAALQQAGFTAVLSLGGLANIEAMGGQLIK